MPKAAASECVPGQRDIATLASLKGAPFEIAFINCMIPHHRSAIDMATLALTHSKRPEVLGLAKAIIATQRKEIADLTA